MITSYVFQLVNLAAGLALLLATAIFLPPIGYLQWILFSTIIGVSIQLEASLSAIWSRRLIRSSVQIDAPIDSGEMHAIIKSYRWFTIIVIGSTFVFGCAYFLQLETASSMARWPIDWLILTVGYFTNYITGQNVCILISKQQIATYSRINIFTRTFNVAVSIASLALGAGVTGLCVSFAISAIISRQVFVRAARRYRPDTQDHGDSQPTGIGVGYEKALIYGAYIFCSYALYRVTLMIEASLHQSLPEQASFGLALQVLSFIFALSIVPITLRVRPLVQAVIVAKTTDSRPVESELALLLLLTNAVYIVAFAVFALTGPLAIRLIGTSGVHFPALADLMLIGLAFWVELNILAFVNVLTARNAFTFVFVYVGTVLLCWTTCYIMLLADVSYPIAGFVAPVLIQGLVMLPVAILLCRSVAGVSLRTLGAELSRQSVRAPSNLHGVAATALRTFRR